MRTYFVSFPNLECLFLLLLKKICKHLVMDNIPSTLYLELEYIIVSIPKRFFIYVLIIAQKKRKILKTIISSNKYYSNWIARRLNWPRFFLYLIWFTGKPNLLFQSFPASFKGKKGYYFIIKRYNITIHYI